MEQHIVDVTECRENGLTIYVFVQIVEVCVFVCRRAALNATKKSSEQITNSSSNFLGAQSHPPRRTPFAEELVASCMRDAFKRRSY